LGGNGFSGARSAIAAPMMAAGDLQCIDYRIQCAIYPIFEIERGSRCSLHKNHSPSPDDAWPNRRGLHGYMASSTQALAMFLISLTTILATFASFNCCFDNFFVMVSQLGLAVAAARHFTSNLLRRRSNRLQFWNLFLATAYHF
jgi:hypothetical protein